MAFFEWPLMACVVAGAPPAAPGGEGAVQQVFAVDVVDEGAAGEGDSGEANGGAREESSATAAGGPRDECESCAAGAAAGEAASPGMPAKPLFTPLAARWGNGFELYTPDEEFTLHIHNLTQFDYRDYSEDYGPFDPQNTFVFPREWLILNGKVTKPVDYFLSFAFGFQSVNVLDVFFNWQIVDERVQIRLGRYKTPFTYEFYALPIYGLVNPERSLFFNNFGLNRDLGAMLWGTVLEGQLDYAAGVFNGARNGFVDDQNDNKDFAGYLNFRPFHASEGALLQHWNFGVSTDMGDQNDAVAAPRTYRTLVPIIGADTVGVAFLDLADDVRDFGARRLWSVHSALYHGTVSLIGEWQSGWQNFSRTGSTAKTRVPIDSFYVQAGWFVTGEEVSMRGVVHPRRPFDVRRGMRGPGAWEPFVRYDNLYIDPRILALTDGRPWTNDVQTFSLGVNWYWNRVVKFAVQWERAWFGDEVFVTRTTTQSTNDSWLVRTQVNF